MAACMVAVMGVAGVAVGSEGAPPDESLGDAPAAGVQEDGYGEMVRVG